MDEIDGEECNNKTPRKRHRLLKKAPDAPKRFKSAYICFVMNMMKSTSGDMKVTDKINFLANEWRSLSTAERMKYEKQARVDKQRYHEEMTNHIGPLQVPNKRQKKHPNAPKRAMSAFLSFSQMRRPFVRTKYPELKNTDISCLIAQEWRAASEEDKRPHVERELRDREKYHEEMAAWKQEVTDRDRADSAVSAMKDKGGIGISAALKQREASFAAGMKSRLVPNYPGGIGVGDLAHKQSTRRKKSSLSASNALLSSSTNLWAELTNANASLGADIFPPDSWNQEFAFGDALYGTVNLSSLEDGRKHGTQSPMSHCSSGSGSSGAWRDFVNQLLDGPEGVDGSPPTYHIIEGQPDFQFHPFHESSRGADDSAANVPASLPIRQSLAASTSAFHAFLPVGSGSGSEITPSHSAPNPGGVGSKRGQAGKAQKTDPVEPGSATPAAGGIAKPKAKVPRKTKAKARGSGPPCLPHYQGLDAPPLGVHYQLTRDANSVHDQMGLFPHGFVHAMPPLQLTTSSSSSSSLLIASATGESISEPVLWNEQLQLLLQRMQQPGGALPLPLPLPLPAAGMQQAMPSFASSTGPKSNSNTSVAAEHAAESHESALLSHRDPQSSSLLPSLPAHHPLPYIYQDAAGNTFLCVSLGGLGSQTPQTLLAPIDAGNSNTNPNCPPPPALIWDTLHGEPETEENQATKATVPRLPAVSLTSVADNGLGSTSGSGIHTQMPKPAGEVDEAVPENDDPVSAVASAIAVPRLQFDRGTWKTRFGGRVENINDNHSRLLPPKADSHSSSSSSSSSNSNNRNNSYCVDPPEGAAGHDVLDTSALLLGLHAGLGFGLARGQKNGRSVVLSQLESSQLQLNAFDAAMCESLKSLSDGAVEAGAGKRLARPLRSLPGGGCSVLLLPLRGRKRAVHTTATQEGGGQWADVADEASAIHTLVAAADSGYYSSLTAAPAHWANAVKLGAGCMGTALVNPVNTESMGGDRKAR